MSRQVTLRAAASLELSEAVLWHEKERAGLGAELADETDRVLAAISKQPDKYPIVRKDVREAPVRRFPYCIYYRIKPQRVVVVSVFHMSRDPEIWQSRN